MHLHIKSQKTSWYLRSGIKGLSLHKILKGLGPVLE